MQDVFDIESWRQVVVASVSELGRTLAGFLPNLVGMIAILLIGWVVSRIVASLVRRGLQRVGLDRVSERVGIADTLRNADLRTAPSTVLGALVFWVLMLTFLLSAIETLGLQAVTTTIDRLIRYLPNVIAATLIVVIGLLLARFIQTLVASAAAAANVVRARQLAGAARGAVVVMVAILALEQLGVNANLLLTVITVLVGTLGVAMGLAFALGSHDIVRGILAGHYLRQSLRQGESVEVGSRKGRVERIGPVDTLVRDEDRTWSIPNARLLNEIVDR